MPSGRIVKWSIQDDWEWPTATATVTNYVVGKNDGEWSQKKKVPVRRGLTLFDEGLWEVERAGGKHRKGMISTLEVHYSDRSEWEKTYPDAIEIRISEDYDLNAHPLPDWCELVNETSCSTCERSNGGCTNPKNGECCPGWVDREEQKPKFKEGDKIQWAGGSSYVVDAVNPMTYTITQGLETFKRNRAEVERNCTLIEEEWKPKVGQWVEAVSERYRQGFIGRVNRTDPNITQGRLAVFCDGDEWGFWVEELKPHKPSCRNCKSDAFRDLCVGCAESWEMYEPKEAE